MFIWFEYFGLVMKFMVFTGNRSNYQGSEVYKREVKINEIFVRFCVAGYGFLSDILTLAK